MTTREIFQQRRQAVVDQIMQKPASFNMATYTDYLCGSTCCLAGWGALQRPDVELRKFHELWDFAWTTTGKRVGTAVHEVAAEWLGLNEADANYVFLGEFADKQLEEITPEEAAAALMAADYVGDDDQC